MSKFDIRFYLQNAIKYSTTKRLILTDKFEIDIIELLKIKGRENEKDQLLDWLIFLENPESERVTRKMEENENLKEAVAEKTAKAAYQTGICKSKTGGTDSESRKGNSGEVRESFYSGSQKDTGDCIKKCFASACHRSLFGASCDDYDSSIFLWGDVCRRNQYHAGRKLYERSGRNRCGRFSFF